MRRPMYGSVLCETTTRVPSVLALPSAPRLSASLSFSVDGTDYVVPIQRGVKLTCRDGNCYCDRRDLEHVDLAQILDPDCSGHDLWILRLVYTIIADSLAEQFRDGTLAEDVIGHTVRVRLPELTRAICGQQNYSGDQLAAIRQKLETLTHGIGILYESANGEQWENRYPLLLWMGTEDRRNTVSLCSPYLNMLLLRLMEASRRTGGRGQILTKKNGAPLMDASHSYLIRTTICKERNKRAAEIVRIVCILIEQAGSSTPNISARTILRRHAELSDALNAIEKPSNRNRLLKTTFLKAWELLRTQTRLTEVYRDIELPTDAYPTMGTLNMVFRFPHKGKKTNGTGVQDSGKRSKEHGEVE